MEVGELRALPGVVGVFRGRRRSSGAWVDESDGLCVHVRWKHDPTDERHRVPEHVDVIEVGLPQADEVEHDDPITGTRDRRSTITLLAEHQGSKFAIGSGHGTLPYSGDEIVQSLAGPGGHSVWIIDGGSNVRGQVLRGSMAGSGPLDWSLIRLPPDAAISPVHRIAGRSPVKLRTAPVRLDMVLKHYSRLESRRTVFGTVKQVAETDALLQLPDDTVRPYSDLILVADLGDTPFSQGGDSGSLVLDDFGEAVGAIVGSSRQARHAYVYPFAPLIGQLGALANAFFRYV